MSHSSGLAPRRAASVAVVAVALAVVALAAAAGPAHALKPLPPRLDVEELARSSRAVGFDEAKLRAAVVRGKPEGVVFSTAIDLGSGKSAVAWAECDQKVCRGYLGTLSGGVDAPRLEKRVSLLAPPKVFAVDGYAFVGLAYTDLDRDGIDELVVGYRVTEPPRRALGSWVREYVAIYGGENLSALFTHEMSKSGADTEQACAVEMIRQGASLTAATTCDQKRCLGVSPRPAECAKTQPRVRTDSWRKAKGVKRYLRTRL